MACIIPKTCVSSPATVLRKCGNISVSERRGDPDVGEICNGTNDKMIDTWLPNDEKWIFISNLNETIYYKNIRGRKLSRFL